MSINVISPEEANKLWEKLYISVQDKFPDHAIFDTFRDFISPPPRLNSFTRIVQNFIEIHDYLARIRVYFDYRPSYAFNLIPWVNLCYIILSKAREIEQIIPGFTAPVETSSSPPYHGYYGSHCLGVALWCSPIDRSNNLQSNYRLMQTILVLAVNEAKMRADKEGLNLDSQMSKACLVVRKLSSPVNNRILMMFPDEACSLPEYNNYLDDQIKEECQDDKITDSKCTLYSLRYITKYAFEKAEVKTGGKTTDEPERTPNDIITDIYPSDEEDDGEAGGKSPPKAESTSNEIITESYSLEEDDDGKSSIKARRLAYVSCPEMQAERIGALLTNSEFTEPREVIYCEAEGKDPSGGLSLGQQYLKAKEAQKIISMDNQRLPFAMAFLAPHDIDLFLGQLNKLSGTTGNINGIANEELAAFLAISFWTSRPVDDVVDSTLTSSIKETPSNVSIYRESKNVSNFALKCKEPELKTEIDTESEVKALRIAGYYSLLIPVQAENVISPWINNIPVGTKIFQHDPEKYEAASDVFFTGLRGEFDSRLNSSRVQEHLHHLISRLPESDTTMAMAISGKDDKVGKVHFHYSGNSITAVQRIYQNAVGDVCGSQGIGVNGATPDQPEENPFFVGSNYVPKRQEIVRIVKEMRNKLSELRRVIAVSPEKLIDFHNEYTSYTVLLTGFCTGYRAVHDPLLLGSEIDRTSGFAVISDKDGSDFYHSRIVWLPSVCLDQLDRYSEHLEHMSRELFWRNQQLFFSSRGEEIIGRRSERAYPGLFYLDQINGQADVRPGNLKEYLKKINFTLPVNSNRHYLRTNLLEKKCSLEVVNAFMGHWEMGLEPWGMFSGFSPDTYKRELSKHLVALVEEDGWDEEIGFRNAKIA